MAILLWFGDVSKFLEDLVICILLWSGKKVQVDNDQEKAQSERNSHSKNRGGKKPNLLLEPHREKTGFLPRRKQRRRSASR